MYGLFTCRLVSVDDMGALLVTCVDISVGDKVFGLSICPESYTVTHGIVTLKSGHTDLIVLQARSVPKKRHTCLGEPLGHSTKHR